MNKSQQANLIKLLAVVTAAPRWVGALLASEGFIVPEDWLGWWIVVSAILSLAMAGVEGWAFAFIFTAWRNQRDEGANKLLFLALLSALVFIIVLTPFVVAQVQAQTLAETLAPQPWAIWMWGAAVASSTILIVGAVGFSQKESEGVSMVAYRELQSVARDRELELDEQEAQLQVVIDDLNERLGQVRVNANRGDELQIWVDDLISIGIGTRQQVVATLERLHNGRTGTQKEFARLLDISQGTVREGQALLKEEQ